MPLTCDSHVIVTQHASRPEHDGLHNKTHNHQQIVALLVKSLQLAFYLKAYRAKEFAHKVDIKLLDICYAAQS